MENVKSTVKKYKLVSIITEVVLVAAFSAAFVYLDALTMSIAMFAYIILSWVKNSIVFNKYIVSPLRNDMDPELFKALIYEGKLFSLSVGNQLICEYCCGNYRNVLSICYQQLSSGKLAEKHKYAYYTYLACCYFDIGDYERLKQVCAYFYCFDAFKLKKRHPHINFCLNYLNGNYPACLEYINKLKRGNIAIATGKYYKARIALQAGNKEEARAAFEELLAFAPKTNYANLAKHAIYAIDNDIDYGSTFGDITPVEVFRIHPVKISVRVSRILLKVFLWINAFVFIISLLAKLGGYDGQTYFYGDTETLFAESRDEIM